MTVVIGDIVRAVLSFNIEGSSVAQNVFTFELQDSNVDDEQMLADLLSWFEDTWLTDWDGLAEVEAVCFLLEVDILNGDGTVAKNIGDEGLNWPGVQTTDILPAAVAGYLQADTERTGSLGRKFIPGISEGGIENGKFNSTLVAILAVLLVDLLESIVVDTTGMLVPGVLSRVTSSFQEFLGSGYTVNVPAYQRRRKPNVGS